MTYNKETGEEEPYAVSIPCPELRLHFDTDEFHDALEELCEAFLDPARTWVFHNMAFDVPILERLLDLKIARRIDDTLLEHHAIYPRTPHDLQAVTTQFFAVEPWKSYYEKRYLDVAEDDIPALLYYNGADTANTVKLHVQVAPRDASREGRRRL